MSFSSAFRYICITRWILKLYIFSPEDDSPLIGKRVSIFNYKFSYLFPGNDGDSIVSSKE